VEHPRSRGELGNNAVPKPCRVMAACVSERGNERGALQPLPIGRPAVTAPAMTQPWMQPREACGSNGRSCPPRRPPPRRVGARLMAGGPDRAWVVFQLPLPSRIGCCLGVLDLDKAARLGARRPVEHDVYVLAHQTLRPAFSNNRQRSLLASRQRRDDLRQMSRSGQPEEQAPASSMECHRVGASHVR
jgi:hypothetical protein